MEEKEKVNGFDDRNIEKTTEIIKENNKRRKEANQVKKDNELPPFLRKTTRKDKKNDSNVLDLCHFKWY